MKEVGRRKVCLSEETLQISVRVNAAFDLKAKIEQVCCCGGPVQLDFIGEVTPICTVWSAVLDWLLYCLDVRQIAQE